MSEENNNMVVLQMEKKGNEEVATELNRQRGFLSVTPDALGTVNSSSNHSVCVGSNEQIKVVFIKKAS